MQPVGDACPRVAPTSAIQPRLTWSWQCNTVSTLQIGRQVRIHLSQLLPRYLACLHSKNDHNYNRQCILRHSLDSKMR